MLYIRCEFVFFFFVYGIGRVYKEILLIIQVFHPNSFTREFSKINSTPGIDNDVELGAENAISGYIIFKKPITFPRRCASGPPVGFTT